MKKFRSLLKKLVAAAAAAAIIAIPTVTGFCRVDAQAAARLDSSKKGLLLESHLAQNMNYLKDLGVHQVTYNLPIGNLCANGNMPFNYNGKTYYFNSGIVGQYDLIVPMLNKSGVSVTLILLNNWNGDATLIHPLSRDFTGANYYMYNTAEQAGIEKLQAIAAFLGSRYSGAHGVVDNWIVGNEVNARQEWNYINASAGETVAAQEYAKALKIFYTGLTAANPNCRVYCSIDHEWGRSDNAALHYGAMSFLQAMQSYISQTGNFNYGVAIHPYNVPLYKAQTWAQGGYATQSVNSPYVTMSNINVLTDFLQGKAYLQTDGQVRSVLCSEIGYTSMSFGGCVSDQNQQAAALNYGYLQALNNQYIDGFFNREVDAPEEMATSGLAMGVLTTADYRSFAPKVAYNMYKNIDNPAQQATVVNWTSAVIGTDVTKLINVR